MDRPYVHYVAKVANERLRCVIAVGFRTQYVHVPARVGLLGLLALARRARRALVREIRAQRG